MQLNLPFESLYLLHVLRQANFNAYLVGGAVRDILLKNKNIKDFDFTTDAKPAEIQALFANSFYENDFGTVSINHDDLLEIMNKKQLKLPKNNLLNEFLTIAENNHKNKIINLKQAKKVHASLKEKATKANEKMASKKEQLLAPFEITTFRSDGNYQDHRRPDEVTWGKNIQEDLSRRDFSINAMAIAIEDDFLSKIFSGKEEVKSNYQLSETDYQLFDQHQGCDDLNHEVIRTVGEANGRFSEDALRMLRAARFAVQLSMKIETNTYSSMKKNHDLLRFVSQKRIGDELMKIMASADPARGIEILDKTGLLEQIMPELKLGKEMEQRGHHISDVWTHSLDALRYCPSNDPIVRLSALLHDVGKPSSYKKEEKNVSFYNHDILGSRIASKIAKRLRLSKKNVERVFILVRYHMFYYQPEHTDASIRRFIKRVGLENIDDILDLREGDRLGSGAKKTSWRLEEMKERVIEQLNQPMDLSDLEINGSDLMAKLKLPAGPMLGKILNELLENVLQEPKLNQRDQLMLEAAKIIQKQKTTKISS